jgi:hypothetical protein
VAAVLLVVGDAGAATAGDTAIQSTLTAMGHTVTLRSDETAEGTPPATGFEAVVIAESVSAATILEKYRTATVPVAVHEEGVADTEHDLVTASGIAANLNELVILDSAHPIAAGSYGTFSGTVIVLSSSAGGSVFGYGSGEHASAVAVAHVEGNTAQHVFIAYDSGDTLTDSSAAPAKRLFVPFRGPAMTILTADGTNLLKNAYEWLLDTGPPPDPLEATAGTFDPQLVPEAWF